MKKLALPIFMLIVLTLTSCFRKHDKIIISFDRVDGLLKGSSVYNKGVPIGEVTHLDLFGSRVLVDIRLKGNIKIPEQSTFSVKENLLGSSYIDIEYSNSQNFLKSDDTTYGKYQKQAIIDNIMADSTKRKNIEKSLEKIATGIGELMESTKDTTQK